MLVVWGVGAYARASGVWGVRRGGCAVTCGDGVGTLAGWNRHMRAWEVPCPACRDAKTTYTRVWRQRNPRARETARQASARRAWAVKRLIAANESQYRDLLREAAEVLS